MIADFGGEAYLDNLRLFEKSKAIPLTNDNASNPEDDKPTPDDPENPADPSNPDAPAGDADTPAEDADGEEDSSTETGKKDDDKSSTGSDAWLWILLSVGGVLLIGGGVTAFLLWRKKQSVATNTEE